MFYRKCVEWGETRYKCFNFKLSYEKDRNTISVNTWNNNSLKNLSCYNLLTLLDDPVTFHELFLQSSKSYCHKDPVSIRTLQDSSHPVAGSFSWWQIDEWRRFFRLTVPPRPAGDVKEDDFIREEYLLI